MKMVHLLLSPPVAAMILWCTGALATAAVHEHVMIVGKMGDVAFDKETKVGDLTLNPGRYKFYHRAVGSDHFVHFTAWSKERPYLGGFLHPAGLAGTPAKRNAAAEVRILGE